MLKDDYETLLRRGMPEQPGLEWNEAWQRFILDDIFDVGISEPNARDLITMHALRWMESMGDSYGVPFRCANIIDAILAATAHLEPRCSQS